MAKYRYNRKYTKKSFLPACYNIFWYIMKKNNYHDLLYSLADEWEFSPNENKTLIKKKYLLMTNILVKCKFPSENCI